MSENPWGAAGRPRPAAFVSNLPGDTMTTAAPAMPTLAPHEATSLGRHLDAITFAPEARAAPSAPAPFREVLVALDASPASEHVMEWTKAIVAAFRPRVTVAHAVPGLYDYAYLDAAWQLPVGWTGADDAIERARRYAESLVETAARDVRAAGVSVETLVLADGAPARAIARAANEIEADLVILGSHRRGPLARVLLGSVADGVKNHVEASVLIAKGPAPPRRVLAATDGSDPSRRAVAVALQAALAFRADATVEHVLPETILDREVAIDPAKLARRRGVAEFYSGALRCEFVVRTGDAATRIAEEAAAGAFDLVVVGSRGLGAWQGLVLGSVSARVARLAPSSVLIVKGAL